MTFRDRGFCGRREIGDRSRVNGGVGVVRIVVWGDWFWVVKRCGKGSVGSVQSDFRVGVGVWLVPGHSLIVGSDMKFSMFMNMIIDT